MSKRRLACRSPSRGEDKASVYLLFMALVLIPLVSRAEIRSVPRSSDVVTHPPGILRFDHPVWSPDGRHLALTDVQGNGVFVYDVQTGTCLKITDAPSSGYAYHWSPDGRRLGFKLLIPVVGRVFPLQMPVFYDLDQRKLVPLHKLVDRAGVPSFAADGRIAFTIDQELRLLDATGQLLTTFPLGHYVNLAPISPDGTRVAYADAAGRLNIIELSTGARTTLAAEHHACVIPVWSPDSTRLAVRTITGRLKTVDLTSRQVYDLDEGTIPSWSPDGRTVFYCKADRIEGVRLIDSDIYAIGWDGTGRTRLTHEQDVHETSASVSPDGRCVVFVSARDGRLYHAPLATSDRDATGYALGTKQEIAGRGTSVSTLDDATAWPDTGTTVNEPMNTLLSTEVRLTSPVPYINQVYDVPDSFDGNWACGATSALMAINYFGTLPYWDITCSWPYPHTSHYGAYVSEIYTYNGVTYDIRAQDASHRWAYGGYGYIVQNNWEDTRGHMRDYIINHGLDSAVDWEPGWFKLRGEVDNNDPFVLLNSLTTAGHYITTIGYFTDRFSAIFNDPYGNKNTPGYPSYDGAGAIYDWPGYNNGYANLNTVHCFIYCRGALPPAITEHPADQDVAWTYDATFTVSAMGKGPFSYQWQQGASNLVDGGHYSGVNSPTLTIHNVTDLQEGEYRCIVSNTYGSTSSNPATLTVTGPPIAPGDLDRDGDVDLEDFGPLQNCLSGAAVPQDNPACAEAQLDIDGDVDVNDVTLFMSCMSGPDVPANPYCTENE